MFKSIFTGNIFMVSTNCYSMSAANINGTDCDSDNGRDVWPDQVCDDQ